MTSQKGSAHVAIIIGLVVLLVGSLGYIFWQQTTKQPGPKEAITSKATEKEVTSNLSEQTFKQAANSLYATYPSTTCSTDECKIDAIEQIASTNLRNKLSSYFSETYGDGGPITTDPILCRTSAVGPAPTYTVKNVSLTSGKARGTIDMEYSDASMLEGTYVINFTAIEEDGEAKIDTITCPKLPN